MRFDRRSTPDEGAARPSSRSWRVERRAELRIALDVDVALKSDAGFVIALAEDLSERGVFVTTGRAVPVGSEVALALTLPHKEVLARGRVRWARPPASDVEPGVGIEFDALPEEDRAAVQAYCAEHRPTRPSQG